MKICVDDREGERIALANSLFTDDNVSVEHLPVGDFVFEDQVVFEYKKFDDFCSSIRDGRLFNQTVRQSEKYLYHYVVLELSDDIKHALLERKFKGLPTVSYSEVMGAYCRLNTYTNVLVCQGESVDALKLMKLQAEKCLDAKVPMVRPKTKKHSTAVNFLVNCVPGVSMGKAKLISESLGIETLNDLLELTVDDLVSIKGIGKSTAEKIINELR